MEKYIDYAELLEVQRRFIDKMATMKGEADRLDRAADCAEQLLRDAPTKRLIQEIRETSRFMRAICDHAADDMRQRERETREKIERFNRL